MHIFNFPNLTRLSRIHVGNFTIVIGISSKPSSSKYFSCVTKFRVEALISYTHPYANVKGNTDNAKNIEIIFLFSFNHFIEWMLYYCMKTSLLEQHVYVRNSIHILGTCFPLPGLIFIRKINYCL